MRPLPKKPPLDAVRNEINVTPLVDVVLVLLIIFMVITPLLARGKDVPLPQTENHSDEKDKLQPVISVGIDSKDQTAKVWLAGASAQGKQELIEIGPLDQFQMIKSGADEGSVSDSPGRVRLFKEITRLWEVAKTQEAKGRVFMKVGNDLPYERIYPLLMAVNEDLSISSIDLGTADKKQK
jgi:biopolymer transport protein ExbD